MDCRQPIATLLKEQSVRNNVAPRRPPTTRSEWWYWSTCRGRQFTSWTIPRGNFLINCALIGTMKLALRRVEWGFASFYSGHGQGWVKVIVVLRIYIYIMYNMLHTWKVMMRLKHLLLDGARTSCTTSTEEELQREYFAIQIPVRPEPTFWAINLTSLNLQNKLNRSVRSENSTSTSHGRDSYLFLIYIIRRRFALIT
jgi:hypothetical protein